MIVLAFVTLQAEDDELKSLQLSLADTQPVGALVKCCKTADQVGVAVLVVGVARWVWQ